MIEELSKKSQQIGNGVFVAYNGVHQAFQIALAAHEAGLLDTFYTSVYDSPGKWGGRLARFLGRDALLNRRVDGLPPDRIVEYPWPELAFKLRRRVTRAASDHGIVAAHRFDRWVAKKINGSPSRVLVGVENCAFHSFQVAKDQGTKLIYDCPGFNARHTQAAAKETAQQFGLKFVSMGDTREMERRKEIEIRLADWVLCCSEVHAESLRAWGVTKEKTVVVPLWLDSSHWYPPRPATAPPQKLRVLYVGGINLRKGIPFLLDAARKLKNAIELTLVGLVSDDVRPLLEKAANGVTILAPVAKPELRQHYWQSDVLVLPSLGDSFGFVALEAMACGLPVIITENCGVPVPDPTWRVPVMDSAAIAQRLEWYAANRNALGTDGDVAQQFAKQFTPERYREQIKRLLRQVLQE